MRLATPADIPLIRALALEVWPVTFADILTPAQIDYMLDMMYSETSLREQMDVKGHQFLIAEHDGEPAGYCGYQIDYTPRVTKVHKIYVLPRTQGSGLGRALLDKVAEIAVAARQIKLRLDVNYQNPAIGFYERMGFNKVDEITTEIGEGYLMEDYVFEIGL